MASELWQRLRAARKFADVRQEDIAKPCNISRAAVAQWESSKADKRTHPGIDQLKTVAKVTQVPLDFFLNDAADPADVWKIGAMAPRQPVVQAPVLQPRKSSAWAGAIEFAVLLERPDLEAGFHPDVVSPVVPDFLLGDLAVEIKGAADQALAAAGQLMLLEKAVGRPLRKAVITLGGEPGNVLGIDIFPARTPDEAANYLIRKLN